jgi:hypothetical protein
MKSAKTILQYLTQMPQLVSFKLPVWSIYLAFFKSCCQQCKAPSEPSQSIAISSEGLDINLPYALLGGRIRKGIWSAWGNSGNTSSQKRNRLHLVIPGLLSLCRGCTQTGDRPQADGIGVLMVDSRFIPSEVEGGGSVWGQAVVQYSSWISDWQVNHHLTFNSPLCKPIRPHIS